MRPILYGAVLALLTGTAVAGASVTGEPAEDATQSAEEQEYPEALEVEDRSVYPEFPDPPEDLPEARLRIVFDLVSHAQEIHAEPGTPFEFHVVAHDVYVAVQAWEARVVVDPRLVVLEREVDGLNLGQGDEIITALELKNCKAGEVIPLARYEAMVPEEGMDDLVLGLAPVSKSTFDPPTPGYLVCRPGSELRTFDACDTCAVVNPVAVEPERDGSSPLDEVLEPIRGR